MAVEFRGCKKLVFAEIESDNNLTDGGYVTGDVIALAPVAEISKSVETSSEAKYYDNKAAIVIDSEGADTVSFTIAVPNDEVLAKLTGRVYDSTRKMFIESERVQKYFAVGYVLGEEGEGEDERMVWRLKGTFNIPDETATTKDSGTGSNNMTLTYTGIYTEHIFANGKGVGIPGAAKALFVRKSNNVATESQYFNEVVTPDTSFSGLHSLSITQASGTVVTVMRDGEALANGAAIAEGEVLTISCSGGTLKVNGTTFTSGNTHTVAGDVAVVSTADED